MLETARVATPWSRLFGQASTIEPSRGFAWQAIDVDCDRASKCARSRILDRSLTAARAKAAGVTLPGIPTARSPGGLIEASVAVDDRRSDLPAPFSLGADLLERREFGAALAASPRACGR